MTLTSNERAVKAANLRTYQQPLLDSLGLSEAKYIPKCAYKISGKMVMGFFPSELKGGVDIYTERVNSQLEPENVHLHNRELLHWKYDAEWDISYPTKSNGHILIPVDEMKVIKAPKKVVSNQTKPQDSTLVATEIAPIKYEISFSNETKDWIEQMIIKYF